MQLVILAAGHGRRYGGLKQLAPVGPNGEAIMDYTAAAAKACGFDGIVLVIRENIEDEIRAHVDAYFPAGLDVDYVFQGQRRGTAEAVASATPAINGPFAVANADDLYDADVLDAVRSHFRCDDSSSNPERHVLIGYRLVRTILTARPVTRGLLKVSPDGALREIVEHNVTLTADGHFEAKPIHVADAKQVQLEGSEQVSMNLWGFHRRVLDDLARELAVADQSGSLNEELLLPEVMGSLVKSGREQVQIIETLARCIGITNPDDLLLVQDELAIGSETPSSLRATRVS